MSSLNSFKYQTVSKQTHEISLPYFLYPAQLILYPLFATQTIHMGPIGALPVYWGAVLFMDVQQICPDLPIYTHPVIAAIRRIS